MNVRFRDRAQAGQLLAEKLRRYANRKDVTVLTLPRGGVPVGYEVASALNVTLDILIVRKLGVPDNPELAMGAIGGDGVRVLNNELIHWLNIPDATIDAVAAKESVELRRLQQVYKGSAQLPQLAKKTVILVDDGIATASTVRAAIAVLRARRPARIVIAVPTAPAFCVQELQTEVEEVFAYATPRAFEGVSQSYEDFRQVSDQDVRNLYERARQRQKPPKIEQ